MDCTRVSWLRDSQLSARTIAPLSVCSSVHTDRMASVDVCQCAYGIRSSLQAGNAPRCIRIRHNLVTYARAITYVIGGSVRHNVLPTDSALFGNGLPV